MTRQNEIVVLDYINAAGMQGRPREELLQLLRTTKGITKPSDVLNKAISLLRKDGFKIVDTTHTQDRRMGIGAVYVCMQDKATEEEYKKPPQSVKPRKTPPPHLDKSLYFETTKEEQSKDIPKIKSPEQIIAREAAILALSSLLDETMDKLPATAAGLLNLAAHNARSHYFELLKNITLETLFIDPSPSRLNRFFRSNFPVSLEEGWNTDIQSNSPKEERELLLLELCKKAQGKGYDEKRTVQKVFGRFALIVPPENA